MNPAEPAAVVDLLAETPVRIAALIKGLSKEQSCCQPSADSWSVNEVLAHLRACADVWGRSIETILTEDHPTFRYVSPRSYIRKTNFAQLDIEVSFQAFVIQRNDLLKKLRSLSPRDWSRPATVKASAKLKKETVLSYAQRLAQHEAGHCDQIQRIVSNVSSS